jgi:peroxiredoxin
MRWPSALARQRLLRIAALVLVPVCGTGILAWNMLPEGAREPKIETRSLPVESGNRSLLQILADRDIIPSHRHPLLGQRAPGLELADAGGKVWKLEKLRGNQSMVLIFYYGCHCIHCVRQLSDINRDLPLFHEVGARVLAASADPPELTSRRLDGAFGFPLLSDREHKGALAYGAFRWAPDGKMPDMLRHATFLIDRDGIVQWVNVGDMPFRRDSALLYQLAKMGGTLP